MTDEQLKKGQDLKSRIDSLKGKMMFWGKATSIDAIILRYPLGNGYGDQAYEDRSCRFVNFDALKTLTLQTMKTELEKLEKEYREL